MPPTAEATLIERAKWGDRDAFGELYSPLERPLAAFLYRMIAIRQDAEDLAQETALIALETIGGFPDGVPFCTWMFRIAIGRALEYLRDRQPWHPDALIRAGLKAAEEPGARRKLQKVHQSGLHTSYDIREHIDFCFTFMGRTLPPHEEAALLLAEVHGFPAEEAAQMLEVSASVLQFRVQQARQTLVDHYETRCSLINKGGTCTQCAGLDTLLHGDRRHTEQALFQIELEPRATAAERAGSLEQRLAIVRSIDPLHAEGTKFHEFLMNFTREVNGY